MTACSHYINDLEEFLSNKNKQGFYINSTIPSTVKNRILFYLKLFIVFYADDTVSILEPADGLQHCKVPLIYSMVFSKGPSAKICILL